MERRDSLGASKWVARPAERETAGVVGKDAAPGHHLWPGEADGKPDSLHRTRKTDYFRYVDTRLRRLEAGGSENSRVRLTGPRRYLKDILDAIGVVNTVYPLLANDGEGGVFAEWKAGPQRIEIAVEDDLTGSVVVSERGAVAVYAEFSKTSALSFERAQEVRNTLARHTRLVNSLNPDWRAVFVG